MVRLQKFSKTRTQLSPGENKLFNAFVRTADYWASYDSFFITVLRHTVGWTNQFNVAG
jgi:hypothetical protein